MEYNFREKYEKEKQEEQAKKTKKFGSSFIDFLEKFTGVIEKIIFKVIDFIARH